ncbi:D-2-hydroxyacid dehydrogenase [Roseateles violae]|uniref:D-2-hydroxyacid dehydrogenase n=1 Tax=Roseateles violae TaxID=3058042 RepID=A0ABT8DYE4_9BURK|nr:D-2-hydroxyacid dehydrogenase [Pelomonas sp. PFR6]MDN3922529.1 D-2-hydroxyacid dehydrogenase [Pelomonas sp. PFR6]
MASLLLSTARLLEHGSALKSMANAADLRLVGMEEAEHFPAVLSDIEAAWYSLDLLNAGAPTGPSSVRFFRLIEACPKLRWLQVMSAGTDLPLYRPVIQRGVQISSGSGIASEPVAHSTVAAVMALSRGFGHWLSAQRHRTWSKIPQDRLPRDLPGQHAVVVGLGPIGLEVSRLLRTLGLRVTGVRSRAEPLPSVDHTVTYEELADVVQTADWLIVCCPLSPRTEGLIGRQVIGALPARAGVVNVSRGAVIDQLALQEALMNGRVGSAYLDVFEREPLPADSPLWSLPNVWISPHNAAASAENTRRESELFIRNLGNYLAGRPLENER